jgi:hypothetical protein
MLNAKCSFLYLKKNFYLGVGTQSNLSLCSSVFLFLSLCLYPRVSVTLSLFLFQSLCLYACMSLSLSVLLFQFISGREKKIFCSSNVIINYFLSDRFLRCELLKISVCEEHLSSVRYCLQDFTTRSLEKKTEIRKKKNTFCQTRQFWFTFTQSWLLFLNLLYSKEIFFSLACRWTNKGS